MINESDAPLAVDLPWTKVGVAAAPAKVYELWTHQGKTATAALQVSLQPHASVFYEVVSK